jgi:predicted  nucleic acid-binding Zn-ribbon protein
MRDGLVEYQKELGNTIVSLNSRIRELEEKNESLEHNIENLRDSYYKSNIMSQKDDLKADNSVFKNIAHLSHKNKNLTGRRDREKVLQSYEEEEDAASQGQTHAHEKVSLREDELQDLSQRNYELQHEMAEDIEAIHHELLDKPEFDPKDDIQNRIEKKHKKES